MGKQRQQANIIFAEGTGSFIILLEIARKLSFFDKRGIDARLAPARGATIPYLNEETPIGVIGAPAALLQAEDRDLKIVATLSTTDLSGHLVAQPALAKAADLRGKRLGVRVIGAGVWISTVLAMQQLGLEPQRDEITTVAVGSPAQIFRALERGEIDAALVTAAQSRQLEHKGFAVLLRNYPAGIHSFDGVLVAQTNYLSAHPEVVEGVLEALVEALAFVLAERNLPVVMQAFDDAFNVRDIQTVRDALQELWRMPYPLLGTLRSMQKIIGVHNPRVLDVALETLIDERFVQKLDESGVIDRFFASYASSADVGRRSV